MYNVPCQDDGSLEDDVATMEDLSHTSIEKDLIKLTSLSNKQVTALDNFLFYSIDITAENKEHLQLAVRRLLFGLRRLHEEIRSRKENFRQSVYVIAGLLCVTLLFFGILKSKDYEITVEPNEGKVIAIESSWWGLVKKEREIKWMKTNDYDFPGWMTQDSNGDWYMYIYE